MSLEIEFPFDFVVSGIPASLQASPRSREVWKERVRAAARIKASEGSWATSDELSVVVVYFPLGPSTIDVDNMLKPILDALTQFIWIDDAQISQIVARKTDRSRLVSLSDPPTDVAAALEGQVPFVYVSTRRMAGHEELPK